MDETENILGMTIDEFAEYVRGITRQTLVDEMQRYFEGLDREWLYGTGEHQAVGLIRLTDNIDE